MSRHRETYYTAKLATLSAFTLFRIEGLTTMNGVPDLIGWDREGRFVAIEVKMVGGKVSGLQQRFLDTCPNAFVAWVTERAKGEWTYYLQPWVSHE